MKYLISDLHKIQRDIHACSANNRVSLDSHKNVVLATQGDDARPFRTLGAIVDAKLLTHDCVDKQFMLHHQCLIA